MDSLIIASKLESLRLCVLRIESKCPISAQDLQLNVDAQDILAVNLTRAVQLCVDISLHVLSEKNHKLPITMAECFDVLASLKMIDVQLAADLKKAVGFRNLAVHQYDAIDWAIVHTICSQQLGCFKDFARNIQKV